MRRITDPAALARIEWIPSSEGGREAPPAGPVYAATAVFELQPGQNGGERSEHFSIMLDFESASADVKIDFLAKDLVREFVRIGARFIVMEGTKAVARGVITDVRFPGDVAAPGST